MPASAKRAAKPVKLSGSVNISHVGSGKYSDVFKLSPSRRRAVIMKVSYYGSDTLCNIIKKVKAGDVAGAVAVKQRDSIQVGAQFSNLTRSLIDTVSPHFVYVYCEMDCKQLAGRLGPLLKQRLGELTPMQRRYNSVCFMEVFHTNLTKFLTRARVDEPTLRGLIFQVLYTLAALQKKLPGFRHNDLSTNNVLIKRLRRRPLLVYSFGGKTWHVWSTVLPAISDYDFVHVPGNATLSNERVIANKYGVDGRPNDSYDSHFFLKSVQKCIHRRRERFPATMAFLERLKMKEQDRQNDDMFARLRPARLLQDPYFNPLTVRPKGAPADMQAAYSA